MPNQLSAQLLSQIFAQESPDPFLTLITISHTTFDNIYLVNNSRSIVSRGNTYAPFPVTLTLPVDDGERGRELSMEFDNVSLELIGKFRSVTKDLRVKIEMILASIPNEVQIAIEDLTIQSISYNKMRISAKLILDNFLNTEISSERYGPSNFPGMF